MTRPVVAFAIVVVLAVVGQWWTGHRADVRLREAQRASCGRGNVIRHELSVRARGNRVVVRVVERSLRVSMAQARAEGRPGLAARFGRQLDELRKVRFSTLPQADC